MKNSKPIIIATVAVAVLGAIGFVIYKFVTKEKIETPPPPPVLDPAAQVVLPTFPLKKGSRGNEVKQLQKWINTNVLALIKRNATAGIKLDEPLKTVTVDGVFGTATENALASILRGQRTMEKSYYDSANIANAK